MYQDKEIDLRLDSLCEIINDFPKDEDISNFNFDGFIEVDHFRVWAEFRVIIENGNIASISDIKGMNLNDREGEPTVELTVTTIDCHKVCKFILYNTKGLLTETIREAYRTKFKFS